MRRYLAYLKYVLKHKVFVFRAGLRIGVPIWRLAVHDWDKFLPDEFFAYAKTFYKPDGSGQYVQNDDFAQAWNLHQKRNQHHWQFWVLTWDTGKTKALKMPEVFIKEMLADWIGAGWAATGNNQSLRDWLPKNINNLNLHAETWGFLQILLAEHFDNNLVNQLQALKTEVV